MNRKIILGLLLLVVAAVSIGAVCANEDTVEINGVEFNIPDGYEKTNSSGNTAFFSNSQGDTFSINVDKDPTFVIRDPATYNGKEGSFYTGVEGTSTEGKFKFCYEEGDVVVTIKTTDESLFEQIIPSE